jgi:hypothetical protein
MAPAPHPAVDSTELAALRAECQRLRELAARQAQEFAALGASLEKKVEDRTAELARTAQLLEQAHRDMHDGFVATVEVFASRCTRR